MNVDKRSTIGDVGIRALSRRSIMKGIGAGVLLTGSGVGAGRAAADTGPRTGTASRKYDAIVIGAGFAGVTAARELHAKGLRVLVIEARDRIGGRTWTDTFHGVTIELGGEAVDPKQPNAWREVQRYNIPLDTGLGADTMYMPTTSGTYVPHATADVVPKLTNLFTPFFDGARTMFPRPYQPLYARNVVGPADKLSFRSRLNQLDMAPADLLWVNGAFAGLAGGDSRRGAYTHLMQTWSLCGYTFEGYLSVNNNVPVNGTSSLAQAILNSAQADLLLNTPVAQVRYDAHQVTVTTTAGTTYRAPVAVLAVPVNVWNSIKFQPALPAAYTAVSARGISVPNVQKLWLLVTGNEGNFSTQPPEGSALGAVRPYKRTPEGLVMFAFAYDPNLDTSNPAVVQAELRKAVPGAHVVDVLAHNWALDPYSQGGWSCRWPGLLTGLYPTVQKPLGRLAFATSDLANGWSGYMDGAIESGMTAANAVAGYAANAAPVAVG